LSRIVRVISALGLTRALWLLAVYLFLLYVIFRFAGHGGGEGLRITD
jgi:hypothetical protein